MSRHFFGNTTSPTRRQTDRRTIIDQRKAPEQRAPQPGNALPRRSRWRAVSDTLEIVGCVFDVLMIFVQ